MFVLQIVYPGQLDPQNWVKFRMGDAWCVFPEDSALPPDRDLNKKLADILFAGHCPFGWWTMYKSVDGICVCEGLGGRSWGLEDCHEVFQKVADAVYPKEQTLTVTVNGEAYTYPVKDVTITLDPPDDPVVLSYLFRQDLQRAIAAVEEQTLKAVNGESAPLGRSAGRSHPPDSSRSE